MTHGYGYCTKKVHFWEILHKKCAVSGNDQSYAQQQTEKGNVAGGFAQDFVQFLTFVNGDHVLPGGEVGQEEKLRKEGRSPLAV